MRAASPKDVPEKFRRQLRKLRTTSSPFDNPVTIYFDGFLKVGGDMKTPTLTNYVSRLPAQQGEISSLLPEEGDGGVVAFGYSVEPENDEG